MQFLKQKTVKKAVAYYRHSAEDKQENSVPIQREHAQKFAAKHNIEIIHEEADEGVSGLIANRPGFKRLFNNWVYNLEAPQFDYVLFYDISRWGRFQDQDEGAYYAFMCKKHGKNLVNVFRGFPQEGQELTNSLIEAIDRYTAADYSKVLSGKVWHGSMKISKNGFSAGGTAPYGMARLLLDENKNPIGILKKGQHKLISNQRVIFTPANDDTTQTIKSIFNLFVDNWHNPNEIAEILNEKGILSANGGSWNASKILRILNNEIYTGTRIYNKTWGRLKQKKKRNPRSDWAIVPNAFSAVIDSSIFQQAQERLFWLMPTHWKKGTYAINKTIRFVNKEIKELLTQQNVTVDNIEKKIKEIPITYSVVSQNSEIPNRCFVIKESIRNYDQIFAVSVSPENPGLIDKVFLIPATEFNQNNFMTFSETEDYFSKYAIGFDKIREHMTNLIK